jgi:hypothetical protein
MNSLQCDEPATFTDVGRDNARWVLRHFGTPSSGVPSGDWCLYSEQACGVYDRETGTVYDPRSLPDLYEPAPAPLAGEADDPKFAGTFHFTGTNEKGHIVLMCYLENDDGTGSYQDRSPRGVQVGQSGRQPFVVVKPSTHTSTEEGQAAALVELNAKLSAPGGGRGLLHRQFSPTRRSSRRKSLHGCERDGCAKKLLSAQESQRKAEEAETQLRDQNADQSAELAELHIWVETLQSTATSMQSQLKAAKAEVKKESKAQPGPGQTDSGMTKKSITALKGQKTRAENSLQQSKESLTQALTTISELVRTHTHTPCPTYPLSKTCSSCSPSPHNSACRSVPCTTTSLPVDWVIMICVVTAESPQPGNWS